ncbi:MAG: phage holin family protein [Patescibacteria group bacterium]
MRILVTVLANALALFLVSHVLDGFTFEGGLIAPVIVAAILTVLNFILKPILKLLSFPLVFLTGGLFLIVLNAFILYLADYLLGVMDFKGVDLVVDGILTYALAAVIFGIANWLIHWLLKDE